MALVLNVVHVLAAAAWFGAMFYSGTILYPRAKRFFESPRAYETFIAALAHGARSVVLCAFAVTGISGLALALVSAPGTAGPIWLALVLLKGALLGVTLVVFWYISWRLWPARLFALDRELPGFDARFRLYGVIMLVLVGANIVLGVMARHFT